MRPRTTALAMLIVLSGCPKAPPVIPPIARPSPTPDQLLEREVATLGEQALALVKEQDEALWAHWTQGAPLELEKLVAKHAVLFEEGALAKVRLARSKGLGNPIGTQRLERWLVGERLARATADANRTLTQQEITATFKLDGKELRWRDVGRLLANEKSAVKRKAIWVASQQAVGNLAESYRQRDAAVLEALEESGTSAETYAATIYKVTAEEAVALARQLLDDTEAEWKQIVTQLAKSELGLPYDKLSRADLPRLLRPSTAADPNFPRQDQAAKGTALLAGLGLYGLPGLTLDLAESAKKNPLPLTIAPTGGGEVRVSFRPAGGARDVSALLAELGRALALHQAKEPADTLPRLSGALASSAAAQLFSELATTPAWLKTHGVSDASAASTIASAGALRLYGLRRAAGNLIAQHQEKDQTEDEAAAAWRTWSARALGVPAAADDAPRWRMERDPLFRGVGLLQAPVSGRQLREKLSAEWWADPNSGAILRSTWSGTPAAGVAPVEAGTTNAGTTGAGTTGAGTTGGGMTDAGTSGGGTSGGGTSGGGTSGGGMSGAAH